VPNDLQSMIFRIAAELGSRFDLAGAVGSANQSAPNAEAIRNAINTAISEYQKQRFRFSEINPAIPSTFATVGQQSVYSTAASPLISTVYWIDYLNIQVGNTLMQLSRRTPEELHLDNQLFNQAGMPTEWAYEGNSIILYPIPDQAYNIYIGAHVNVAGPATDNEVGNPWMISAELLIRSRAKYEIALNVTRNKDMIQMMDPENGATYRAWRSLKGEGNKITGTGKIRAMQW
jgi:hypothetical protein